MSLGTSFINTSGFFGVPVSLGSLFASIDANNNRRMGGEEYCCSINDAVNKISTLCTPAILATAAYIDNLEDHDDAVYSPNKIGFVGQVSEERYVAEYVNADQSISVCSWSENGVLQASIMSPTGAIMPADRVGRGAHSSGIIVYLLAMLPFLMKTLPDVKAAIEKIAEYSKTASPYDVEEESDIAIAFYVISDAFYRALKSGLLKCNISVDNNIDVIPQTIIDFGVNDDSQYFSGTPKFWGATTTTRKRKTTKKNQTIASAKSEFSDVFGKREWTDAEREMIPVFPDDFPVPETVMKMARRYAASRDSKRPAVNFGWRGPTSIGKSTGVEILACVLGIPLVHMTCYPDMETSNFMSEFVPDTTEIVPANNLPTFMDIFDDPVESYAAITGEKNENADCDMCLKAYAKAMAAAQSDTPRFKHVESPYVKALRNGWMVEIAEPSRIRDSGTLVGLNGVDKPGSVVTLMDGSSFKRHPDAIVVFTDNVGYISCRPIDNAVIRRLSFIIDSKKLSKKELFARTKYNTGFEEDKMLDRMYDVFAAIETYCHDNDITSGSVSPTEFEMWALFVKGDEYGNLRDNCIDAVVSKATDDADLQQEIIASCVDRFSL